MNNIINPAINPLYVPPNAPPWQPQPNQPPIQQPQNFQPNFLPYQPPNINNLPNVPLQIPIQQNQFIPPVAPIPPIPAQYQVFQQLPNIHHEIANHNMPRHLPIQQQLAENLIDRNATLTSHQTQYALRAKMLAQPAHLRTQLHSVEYKPAQIVTFNPLTGRNEKQIGPGSLEDHIIAHCQDPKIRQMYAEEHCYTKEQQKIMTKLQFNELKKQSLATLSETAKNHIVHSYTTKIITSDIMHRFMEEHWNQIKQIATADELTLLAVTRSVNLQVDSSVYTCLTRQESDLLKIAQEQSKHRYRIKRDIASIPSQDPLIAMRPQLPLMTTTRTHINPLTVFASNLPTAPTATTPLAHALLTQSIVGKHKKGT